MFELLINRRFLLLGTLIILATFIFFICIYSLENVYYGDFTLKKYVTWNIKENTTRSLSQPIQIANENTSKLPDHMCYKNEPFVVIESCIACSQFERKAVNAVYCFETGLYDKLNCTRTKRLGLKPCYEKTSRSAQFNLFMLLCTFCSVISYGFVSWRQNFLRKQSLARMQNQFN